MDFIHGFNSCARRAEACRAAKHPAKPCVLADNGGQYKCPSHPATPRPPYISPCQSCSPAKKRACKTAGGTPCNNLVLWRRFGVRAQSAAGCDKCPVLAASKLQDKIVIISQSIPCFAAFDATNTNHVSVACDIAPRILASIGRVTLSHNVRKSVLMHGATPNVAAQIITFLKSILTLELANLNK